jgi:hypothetical protein
MPPGGFDPNVSMPPHVVAAMKKSDETFKQTYDPAAAQQNDAVDPNAPPAAAAPPNGAAPNGAPAPNGTPAAAPGDGELSETNPDGSINWENRFKAMKGRRDAEAQRHREAQEATEARLRELSEQLAEARRQPLPGENFDPKNPPRLVSEQEVQEYGADLIDVIRRTATETLMPMIAPIATKVGQVEGQAQATARETQQQFLHRMHGFMHQTVPGWEELNTDPKFIDWTKKADVYSGQNRQELLQRAWNNGDARRVAAFFQGFLAEEAATDPAAAEQRQRALAGHVGHAPPAAPNGTGQPAPNGQHQAAPRVTLEQLAAPGRARAAATPPAGKPTWTAAGIASFYQDVAAGKFRGREQERIATEADLMAAQREGRIEVNPRTATHIGR